MTSLNSENLSPEVLKRITLEIKQLKSEHLPDVDIQIDESDFTSIFCQICGPDDTPFSGGKFKLKLTFPANFPSSPPKAHFLTKIFHPNVEPRSGEICVNTLKRDWRPNFGVKHILLVIFGYICTIKSLLINPNPESALNEEAGKLLLENYQDFCRRAKMWTEIHATTTAEVSSSKRPIDPNETKLREKSKKMLRRL
uniref:E2 ubiquitin-conjugating enzyme n=1 Tax=Romanomermis culicivorax TaxID=13658 RepID=A0A915ISN8_ROMCU